MVSGAFGIAIIGIGIIVAIFLLPRQILSPEKAKGFVGTFGLQPAQAQTTDDLNIKRLRENDPNTILIVNGIAGGKFAPTLQNKQVSTQITKQAPTIAQPPTKPTLTELGKAFGSPEFDPLLEKSGFTFAEFFRIFRGGFL